MGTSLDPLAVVALALAGISFLTACASLFLALRSTPTRVLGELDGLLSAATATARVANAATADVGAMRDEWARHRLEVAKLLDEAIDAMDQAERKRRSARAERTHAEKVKEEAHDAPASFMCPSCRYEHLAGEDCMSCARRRFAAQGLAV